MSFDIDTSKPATGPYRMPTENEPRTRIYFKTPFRDCPTVCELCPDLQEFTDPTLRLLAASWDMRELIKEASGTGDLMSRIDEFYSRAQAILSYIEKG